jgi:hypothetical protein
MNGAETTSFPLVTVSGNCGARGAGPSFTRPRLSDRTSSSGRAGQLLLVFQPVGDVASVVRADRRESKDVVTNSHNHQTIKS